MSCFVLQEKMVSKRFLGCWNFFLTVMLLLSAMGSTKDSRKGLSSVKRLVIKGHATLMNGWTRNTWRKG
uniref:Uncharacterized protein n=1 Tax=Salix viminalis TaxID=40686 RepID=A0A6N2M6D4_SALVM